jgi:hypothetical protein
MQTLIFGALVATHMRRALLADLIKGGDARLRWSSEEGERALHAIKTQRQLLASVEEFQARERSLFASQRRRSPQKLPNSFCESAQMPLGLEKGVSPEANGQSLQREPTVTRFVQQQRTLRNDMLHVSAPLRQRRRRFRLVCSS